MVASAGEDPPSKVDDSLTALEAGDDMHWLLLRGRPVTSGDRLVLGAVANQAAGLVHQTQLQEEASAAQAVMEADKLRRALLSAVSHDLRTPLAAAKAAVSSLRSDDVEFSPEDTAELLETIEESVDQLTGLVGNLLDSSRLAVGVIKPQVRKVYLDEVVHHALMGMGTRGMRRTTMDRVKVDVDAVSVRADPGLLERVLANLIDNAARYSPAIRWCGWPRSSSGSEWPLPWSIRVLEYRPAWRINCSSRSSGSATATPPPAWAWACRWCAVSWTPRTAPCTRSRLRAAV